MPIIGRTIHRNRGLRRPPRIAGINRADPLARGLIVYIPWGEFGLHEIATGYAPTSVDMNTVNFGAMPQMNVYGPTWENNDTAQDEFLLDTGGKGVFANLSTCTLSVWGVDWTQEGNGGAIWSERPSANPIWKFVGPGESAIGTTEAGFVRRNANGTGLTRIGTTGDLLQDGLLHNVTMVVNGSNVDFYVDGVLNNQHTGASTGSITATDPEIGWDLVDSATNSRLKFPVPLIAGWNRALSAAEILEHYKNPWGVTTSATLPAYFIPAAAGGGATTDVPLTTFSVSPQAPTTLRSLISNVPTL